jgi:hypothetical protein
MCDFPVDAERLAEQLIAWVMEGAEQLIPNPDDKNPFPCHCEDPRA